MSRQDSSFGIRNYMQTITGSSATPLLSPSYASVNSAFPSPLFPLSSPTYPVAVFVGVPPNTGLDLDGHPFEVSLAASISGTATTNILVNLYNAPEASWKDGPYAGTYTAGTLGAGCTEVVTGTATAGITASASINVLLKAKFAWSSATGILGCLAAEQYLNGSTVPIVSIANVSSLTSSDLNFIPQFTFAGGGTNTVKVLEFVINWL